MLRRAFQNVREGCYLDIGAAEPEADSVTKAFYDLGWRGINVEPLAGPFDRLVAARPRDINLNVAVGPVPGEAPMFVVGDESGLSTLDPALAAEHKAGGWALQERRVQVTTLAQICEAHVSGDLHFLKIDAEGAELGILRSADFTRWRPWIILLEAVDPVTHRPSPFEEWEHEVLTPNHYVFVYDDGLNRFYAASEHEAELRAAFRVPPNVFDNFVRVSEVRAAEQVGNAETIARLEILLHSAQERADFAQSRVHAAQATVEQEQARTAEAKAQAIQIQAALDEAAANLRRADERTAAADARCTDLEGAITVQAARMAEVEDRLARAAAERDGWAQELFEANRHAAELVASRQAMIDQLAWLRPYAEWRTDEAGQLNSRIAAAQDEVDHLKGVIAEAQRDLELARAMHESLAATRDEAQRDRAALQNEVAGTQTRLTAIEQELHRSQQWLHAVRQSSSWRVTRPVRVVLRLLGRG